LKTGATERTCAKGQEVTGGYITCKNKTRCGVGSANGISEIMGVIVSWCDRPYWSRASSL